MGLEVVRTTAGSGRQTGVVQSFPQIMGFLNKGRGAARKARASFCPTLGCFSEAQ